VKLVNTDANINFQTTVMIQENQISELRYPK
jgi:hypothetical protein